jgi:hypothetical protein
MAPDISLASIPLGFLVLVEAVLPTQSAEARA